MTKSYLCIGGPLHGNVRALDGAARHLVVPVRDAANTFSNELASSWFLPSEERYTVKPVLMSEKQEQTVPGYSTACRVSVELTVDVLAHESILTVEELAAHIRKMLPQVVRDSVQRVVGQLQLAR